MVLSNFKIGNGFGSVIKDNVDIDLHNNFDFAEYNYNVAKKEFQIIFNKGLGEWAVKETFNKLIFTFSMVNFLKVREGNLHEYPDDESCLATIGIAAIDMRNDMDSVLDPNFVPPDFDILDMDSVLDPNFVPPDFDILFVFEQGQSIKVHSNEVFLETL